MATLRHIEGPHVGLEHPLESTCLVIGRQSGVDIHLDSVDVSRRHAQISREQGRFFLEDLGSSNGTYLNGQPVSARSELRPGDRVRIGPFVLQLETEPQDDVLVRAELAASTANRTLFQQGPGGKLAAVLEIAQHLARTLHLDDLLPRLLDCLLGLFPQAERGLILLCEGEELVPRATRTRKARPGSDISYSRSVVRRVLQEGVGIMADDVGADQRFSGTQTLAQLGIRSFLCVPFKDRDGRPLGVLQLDRLSIGAPFTVEDLHLLTTISLQVSVVLENAALHARLLEQERIKRDLELARLSQLVAGIAHEINNPLAFVSNNLALLSRETQTLHQLLAAYREADPVLGEHRPALLQRVRALAGESEAPAFLADLLERSRDGLRRIAQIVGSLSEFARLDRSTLDEVNLNVGVESAVNVIRGRAARQGVELELQLAPLPGVLCYPAKINQVVYHLLANALDACPDGGKVTVCTRPCTDGVEIIVQDTGHGIDPAIRDKVFDPFFTTRPLGKGAGLGLSISYGIVKGHGGTIEFDSAPGRGTCFTVRLPLRPPANVRAATGEEAVKNR